ncbi:MAG: hypothetical protein P4L84_33700 [Isosphaeraceae bacterium]|nr:hypothetical protein [Isosphaeraceae bacterium]
MRTQGEPALLELISAQVRRTLITHREMAMRGDLEKADSALRDEITQHAGLGKDLEVVALAMLRAELLYLDEQDTLAREQFEVLIRPRLNRLDLPIRFAVEQNHIDLRINRFGPDAAGAVSEFYHLADRRRVADVEWRDSDELAAALEAIEDGNHRKAMSALWYTAVRTYRQGYWGSHRVAMRRLGQEWLRIGKPADAAYCAILAQDDRLARSVAEELLRRMDPTLVGPVIGRVLAISNLRKHFSTACELLVHVNDAIADDQLRTVAEWLLSRCSLSLDDRGTGGPLCRSWRVLQPIALRLPTELVRRAVLTAVSHPAWTGVGVASGPALITRAQIVKTVSDLALVLPGADLEALAHQVLPLAYDRLINYDYIEVINLLCRIAERGNENVRRLIGDRLFEPGRPRYDILAQVAHIFGREFLPADRLEQLPTEVAKNVRLQVQRRPRGQAFENVPGTIMAVTHETQTETIVSNVVSMMDWHAVASHARQVSPDGIREMVVAAVDMLVDPDNDLSNRVSLVSGLMGVSSVIDEHTAKQAFETLEQIGRGEIARRSEPKSDPFSSFNMRTCEIEDLQGIAIVGAARIGAHFADLYRERVESLLEDALCDPHVDVRRGAFAAFRDFPVRSEGPLLAVLLGTRDADPVGAVTAFAALAEKEDLALNRNHWRLLLYSTRLASRSAITNLRRHAAACLSGLIGRAPGGAIRTQAEEILNRFRSDICASVREAAVILKQRQASD